MKTQGETIKRRFKNLMFACLATATVSFGSVFAYICHTSIQQDRAKKAIRRDIEDQGYKIEDISYDKKVEKNILGSYFVFDFKSNNGNEYKAYYSRRNFKHGKYITTNDYADFFEKNSPYIELSKESESNKIDNIEEAPTIEQN